MHINRRTLATSVAAFPFLNAAGAFSQGATPSTDDASDLEMAVASSRFTSLGQYLPGGKLDGVLDLIWVDVERQLFSVAPGTEGEERTSAFVKSTFGNVPNFFLNALRLKDMVGFGELDILQAVSTGVTPNSLQMVRLTDDVAGLVPVWLEQGFEERENEYGSFWTIGENGELDLSNPLQQMLMAQFNNIAILEDRVIAFAPTSDQLSEAMSTAVGDHLNVLAELAPVTDALPETAVSAWMIDGSAVAYSSQVGLSGEMQRLFDDLIAESNDAAGQMPAIRTICSGTTEGASRDEALHEGSSAAFITLDVEGDAEQAAAVIDWRLENIPSPINGRTYAEIVGEVEFEPVSDSLLRISSRDGASRAVFSQMIMQADILLFAWQPAQ